MKHISRTLSALLALCLLFTACGAFAEAEEPDYYHIGLKVTALMSEIADSEAYLSFLSYPEACAEAREAANTHDYDRPVAVYSVTLDDPRVFMESMLSDNEETLAAWNSLSPALQEQLLKRVGVATLVPSINGRMGSEYSAFSTITIASVTDETLPDKSVCYLYLFEKGTPILVTFGWHGASGVFVFIPEESRGSAEDLYEVFLSVPGLTLTPIQFADEPAYDPMAELSARGIDVEAAAVKMHQAIGENLPPSAMMPYPDPTNPTYKLADVTEDGCPDLCTCVTWGSGMVRTDLIVYDPVEEALYVLDGYNYDYIIDRVDNGRLVVVMEGPNGYNDPVTRTYGTVTLQNRQLIFTPDEEQP